MSFKFSNRSIQRMQGVHPELIKVFTEALKVSPIDFGIPGDGGVRNAERQFELYQDGKSKCDGYRNISKHQIKEGQKYGHALDFYAFVNGKASWDSNHLSMVAAVIMSTAKRLINEGEISIQLLWGGQFGSSDFNGFDRPHFEVFKV